MLSSAIEMSFQLLLSADSVEKVPSRFLLMKERA